jgi:UDP-glucuronate decarboxylase
MEEIARKIISLTNSNSGIIYLDLPQNDPKQRKPDLTLAETKIGWSPNISIDEGLNATIAYFRNQL